LGAVSSASSATHTGGIAGSVTVRVSCADTAIPAIETRTAVAKTVLFIATPLWNACARVQSNQREFYSLTPPKLQPIRRLSVRPEAYPVYRNKGPDVQADDMFSHPKLSSFEPMEDERSAPRDVRRSVAGGGGDDSFAAMQCAANELYRRYGTSGSGAGQSCTALHHASAPYRNGRKSTPPSLPSLLVAIPQAV
jgi:hypothetical protein